MSENKSFWGIGIALLYTGFALFIITIVLFVSFQDYQLVEDDYYQKELKYQGQINKQRNTSLLTDKLRIKYDNQLKNLEIKYPNTYANIEGTLLFYRPSDKMLDFHLPIEIDTNFIQDINCNDIQKGLWFIKINWQSNSTLYYYEEKVYIN